MFSPTEWYKPNNVTDFFNNAYSMETCMILGRVIQGKVTANYEYVTDLKEA